MNEAGVPFLVVGGIAVMHHGYGRMTQDVDLVIKLERASICSAFRALDRIGYRPIVPVSAEEFSDPGTRATWRSEKNMAVLRFWNDAHPETPLGVFVDEPFDFSSKYVASDVRESAPGLTVRIVTLKTLLAMKRAAGRMQDLADIDELSLLHGGSSSYDRPT